MAHRVIAAVGLLALACSAFGAEGEEAPPAVVDAGSIADGGAVDAVVDPVDAMADSASTLRPCGSNGAFCDDFEGRTGMDLLGPWTSSFQKGPATLTLMPAAGYAGSAGLRAFAPGDPVGDQQALLTYDRGPALLPPFTITLGFAANLDVTKDLVIGPRIKTESDGDPTPRRDIVLWFSNTAVRLGQSVQNCTPLCGTPPDTDVLLTPGWHRYGLRVTVGAADPIKKIYGTVRLFVDDELKFDTPLWLPLASASKVFCLFGITYAAKSAEGTLMLDDAYFDMH